MTENEMYDYCESNRGESRFCNICSSCSGPSISNLASDHPMPEGITVFRGGRHGSCRFEVEDVSLRH